MAATDAAILPAAALARLLDGYSIEISPRQSDIARELSASLAPGAQVYVSFPQGENHHQAVRACVEVRRAGFEPVPHLAVRNLASFTQLKDFVARLTGEAGIRRALAVAGDADPSPGPFRSSLDLFESGLLAAHGIHAVGISGYPEGHARIDSAALDAATDRKIALAAEQGIDLWFVTQFCFEAAPILAWLKRLRARGLSQPVRLGLAGPASVGTLIKFAVRCGIGNSLRTLKARPDLATRLPGEAGPDRVVLELADKLGEGARAGVEGLHFYAFGGVARTAQWIRALRDRA